MLACPASAVKPGAGRRCSRLLRFDRLGEGWDAGLAGTPREGELMRAMPAKVVVPLLLLPRDTERSGRRPEGLL